MPKKDTPHIRIYSGIPTENKCCELLLDEIKKIYDDVTETVTFDKGKAIIDWRLIDSINNEEGPYSERLYSKIILHLEELDILSSEKEDTFSLIGCNVILNPRLNSILRYFTREKDAIAYKEIVYKNAGYEIDII